MLVRLALLSSAQPHPSLDLPSVGDRGVWWVSQQPVPSLAKFSRIKRREPNVLISTGYRASLGKIGAKGRADTLAFLIICIIPQISLYGVTISFWDFHTLRSRAALLSKLPPGQEL